MQKEAPAMVPLLFEIRSPHPPASAGTFSQWEKDITRCGLSKKGSRSSQWEEREPFLGSGLVTPPGYALARLR